LLLPVHLLPDRLVRQNHPVHPVHRVLQVEVLVADHRHWVDALDVAPVLPETEVVVLPSEGLVFLQRVGVAAAEAFH
jgi:hypothetical protein